MNKSFGVIKTTNNGLNLHLLAKSSKRQLHYPHFMDIDAGAKLITALRKAVKYLEKISSAYAPTAVRHFFMGMMFFQLAVKIKSAKDACLSILKMSKVKTPFCH